MKINKDNIIEKITTIVNECEIFDIHTHLYSEQFGELMLYGFDEMITYHYLIAETLRIIDIPYSDFFSMKKRDQADLIYKTLFIERSPISESCRGILTTLKLLGLNINSKNTQEYRDYTNSISAKEYTNLVLEKAKIKKLVMTNDPFNQIERKIWKYNPDIDSRFKSALRLDYLINDFKSTKHTMLRMGYNVTSTLTGLTKREIKRFLRDWIVKTNALYMAISVPPDFTLLENSSRAIIIEECVLEVSYELNIPFALMIGVKRQTNPELELAGDSCGKSNIETIEYLCKKFNKNKFMVTLLSRENQHELAVLARKYRNLFIFGCWWFLNNPSLIKEVTTMRTELLGLSFMPQHSDARILDQLLYKWAHNKEVITKVLIEKYNMLLDVGWELSTEKIEEDVNRLFYKNFEDFLNLKI